MVEVAVVVLAAGKGTRMKSALPKVMHKLATRTLLGHVLTSAKALSPQRLVVVAGPDMPELAAEAQAYVPYSEIVIQQTREGTGHAVLQAREALQNFSGIIVILYGDCPLIEPATLIAMVESVKHGCPATILGFEAEVPTGYGRMLTTPQNTVTEIVEELDATSQQKLITLCNSGVISIQSNLLWPVLAQIKNDNAKHEYYLTDSIKLLYVSGQPAHLAVCPIAEVAGVNDRQQLAEVEAVLQKKYRQQAMLEGVTLLDPASVYFAADTVLGQDVVIEPNVFFGAGVRVSDNVTISAHCYIEGANISSGAIIGPFARLRPTSEIGPDVHIGNFVEIKNSRLEKGSKANHLSYIGDATIGATSNIGAGTITCNYNGFEKHKTIIGNNVFIGSNTSLVAPVTIDDGAMIAAGSVITRNVPADAMAIERSPQTAHNGWAKRYRKLQAERKAAQKDNPKG